MQTLILEKQNQIQVVGIDAKISLDQARSIAIAHGKKFKLLENFAHTSVPSGNQYLTAAITFIEKDEPTAADHKRNDLYERIQILASSFIGDGTAIETLQSTVTDAIHPATYEMIQKNERFEELTKDEFLDLSFNLENLKDLVCAITELRLMDFEEV